MGDEIKELTEEGIQGKLDKGEDLTPEETEFVKSTLPPGVEESGAIRTEDFPTGGEKKTPEKKTDEDKSEEEKKSGDTSKPDKKDEEDTKPDKDKEKSEEEKKAETAKVDKEKADDESFDRIMSEVEKGEGQEDLSNLTKREKGLFWELRKERKSRQQAESDLSILKLEKVKAGAKKTDAGEGEEKSEVEKELDELADDDFLSKKQVKALFKKAEAPQAVKGDTAFLQTHLTGMWRREGKSVYEDFDDVLKLSETIIPGNAKYAEDIKKAFLDGDNPYIVTYDLIKNDSRFESLYRPSKKEIDKKKVAEDEAKTKAKEAEDKAKRIKENANKAKTSGGAGGGGEVKDDLSPEEIQNLSQEEWEALPKKTKDRIFERFG